jgi:translation initiation factor 4E
VLDLSSLRYHLSFAALDAMAQQQWLSFNESVSGKGSFGLPEEESEDIKEALKQPMKLKDTWVLWEQVVQDGSKAANYGDNTKQVTSFSTVQEFWAIWNGMPQPSELLTGSGMRIMRNQVAIDAIMIFKDGVKPEWEDKLNQTGGHFQIQLKPNTGGGQIDEYWNNLVLGMVGGTLEPSDMITGLRLVDKLGGQKTVNAIRIELWFAKYNDQNAVNLLKKNMEKCLGTRVDGSVAQLTTKPDMKPHSTIKH